MLPYAKEYKEPEEEEEVYDYEKEKEVKWYHVVLLNRPLKVVMAIFLTAVVAPMLIYLFFFFPSSDRPPSDGLSVGSCLLPRTVRIPCGVGYMESSECHPHCCYDEHNDMCFHRFPSRFSFIMNTDWTENVLMQPRVPTVPYRAPNTYPNSFQHSLTQIRLSIDEISPTHMSMTFYNSRQIQLDGKRIEEKDYSYLVSSPELNVQVNGNNGNLFNTVRGPLIASDNIWEIAFRLTNETIYGLDEIPLRADTIKILYNNDRGMSSIPLIFARSNGTYHGLLIDAMEPTEVRVQSENQIVVRSITTMGIKLHVFVGPQPRDIMRDVMKLIGFKKRFEYWMLGAHVCSDLSETPSEAYDHLNQFLTNTTRDSVPFESHCGVKPIIHGTDYCETEETDYVDIGARLLQSHNKRFVPHISPFITKITESEEELSEEISPSEESALNSMKNKLLGLDYLNMEDDETTENVVCHNLLPQFEDIMLRTSNFEDIYIGKVGEKSVIYPDYEAAPEIFMEKLWPYESKPDGFILENNWPLDESYKSHNYTYNYLPYFSENFEEAFNHTPQWNISRANRQIYMRSHNEYGNNFIKAFRKLHDDVPIASSSQWMNGDIIVNRQNINATWTNLQNELVAAAMGGISGHWFWSTPVCGDTEHFDSNTQINLCVKWYMAATYFPIFKIDSKEVPRDPLSFIGINRLHVITALNRRLSLLPYFFSTLQNGPLLRPMFYQFPTSEALVDLNSQFSVGDDLLIIPNLQPNQTHVHVRMPPGVWYEFKSGLQLDFEEGEIFTMTTTEADFLTLIRGSSIVVTQKNVKTTAEQTRLQSDFELTVALECETRYFINEYLIQVNYTVCHAETDLFMTEDLSLHFVSDANKIVLTAQGENFESLCETPDSAESKLVWAHTITDIHVYGLTEDDNNYDHHKHVLVSIDMCSLQSTDKIEFMYNSV